MRSVSIELGDTEYELEVSHFEPAVEPNRRGHPDSWTPGDGGEVEVGDTVKVLGLDFVPNGTGSGNAHPAVVDVIDLKDFIRLYAEYHDVPDLRIARESLLTEVYDCVVAQRDDDFDDNYDEE